MRLERFRITRVSVAHHTEARVIGHGKREALVSLARPVGNHGDPRARHVAGISASAGVNGDEIGLRSAHRHGVEQRPVRDRIGSVAHALSHNVRMRHRARVEMVAREGDQSRQQTVAHHAIDRQRQGCAFAVAEPGDPAGSPSNGT